METVSVLKSFHSYFDNELIFPKKPSAPQVQEKHYIIKERELSYRFFAHHHPYAAVLARRLIQTSTASLQAADTEYVRYGDGAYAALPGSMAGELAAEVMATPPVGPARKLPAGTRVPVPDGAAVTLGDGSAATLPGRLVLDGTRGLQLNLGGMNRTLPFGEVVTLNTATAVVLPDGSPVTLPAGATLAVMSCLPQPKLFASIFSPASYKPSPLVQLPYPVSDLDFSSSGAYSVYNWEVFFHIPITIAINLSKNGRYAEAQKWFHFIFDPTDDSDGPTPERFWKVRPFQSTDVHKIEEIMANLSSNADPALREETVHSIEAWKANPFRPHVIARYRQQAYMFKTVMAYLDNLIEWGDSLFRQDTGESVDEALMLYVLAANILGPRPQAVPQKGSVKPQTYASLRADLDKFGNALREMEADIPFDLMPLPSESAAGNERLTVLRSLGKTLYFGVPRNDKLLAYWDMVADRLFKIHNSLNIQGVFRRLALFEPPIDPALLARAAASGLDIGAVVSGLNQPLPLVRFRLLAEKAAEIAQEVKQLGAAVLAAMEKEDTEALAVLRARHTKLVMQMAEQVKYAAVQEANKHYEGLLKTLDTAVRRYTYYERQLGQKAGDIKVAQLEALDKAALEKMKLQEAEPEMAKREIEVDVASSLEEAGKKVVSRYEVQAMDLYDQARKIESTIKDLVAIAKGLSLIPDFGIKFHFWGLGGDSVLGGTKFAEAARLAGDIASAISGDHKGKAQMTANTADLDRRMQEWSHQSVQASSEIDQINKQIRAAQIRQAIAEQELKNHREQMKHAEEIEHFLNAEGRYKNAKNANQALYAWLKREVKGLYGQAFQFAFDVARKAERALQHELGDPSLTYLQYGYLSGKEGFLAGEKLWLDIQRMQVAYHDLNQREYELTRKVSIKQVDPLALLRLRATGRASVTLPEALFDMDGPGHYFRRIKSVAVSLPGVSGGDLSTNLTLTLLKSSIRTSPNLLDGLYERESAEDSRFSDSYSSTQSIVTSTPVEDSGLFETDLNGERYLPFENAGAISEWQLELPANPAKGEPRSFDYDTIQDVVLSIRYTARPGGGLLRKGAMDNLSTLIDNAQAAGSVRLFSVKDEFPTEWAQFKAQVVGGGQRAGFTLALTAKDYPFWSKGRLNSVQEVEVIARSTLAAPPASLGVARQGNAGAPADTLVKDASQGGLLVGKLSALPASPVTSLGLFFDSQALDNVWVAVKWGA